MANICRGDQYVSSIVDHSYLNEKPPIAFHQIEIKSEDPDWVFGKNQFSFNSRHLFAKKRLPDRDFHIFSAHTSYTLHH